MRILLLVDCYLPSTKSSAKLIHDLAFEFLRAGHEPVVVAPDEEAASACREYEEDGIRVLRIRTGRIKGASRVLRAFNELQLSQTLWRRGEAFFRENPAELILYYAPTIFFGPLVKRLKKAWGCPAYLVLRDIFPQWAVDAGILSKGSVYRFFKWWETLNYDAADIIGVQSPANLDYFARHYGPRGYRLDVLYNWTPLREEPHPVTHVRCQLGLDGKVVFFYGGNIGVAQDMDNVLRLADHLTDEPKAYFLLVGEGSEVERLRKEIATRGLANIVIKPAVDHQRYLAMLSEFDVGLISLDRNLRTQNFPGKMLGYMYHAKPILASINPGNDLKTILEENEAGLAFINGEDEALAEGARRLIQDPSLRHRLGQNARMLLEKTFSAPHAASQILSHFSTPG